MKRSILVIADGRSPITLRWLEALNKLNFEISLVSTYPVEKSIPVKTIRVMPLGFTGLVSGAAETGEKRKSASWKRNLRRLIQIARPLVFKIRAMLGPLTLPKYEKELKSLIEEIKPDIVHALRIPYEGMLARVTPADIPLVVSVWGNDFTLHANASVRMKRLTKEAMQRANGLLADVERDILLGRQWGFSTQKTALVVPGGGGIHFEEIEAAKQTNPSGIDFQSHDPVIINPRGIRAYARSDVFFKAIPLVLERFPRALFLCVAMKDQAEALHWYRHYNLEKNVLLLPLISQAELWSLFHRSQISVSITTHDGTPNTLIEAMACGCFPIAGDIESIREWITPGVNGLLVPPDNHEALARAIIKTVENTELLNNARVINRKLLLQKADANLILQKLKLFYDDLLNPDS